MTRTISSSASLKRLVDKFGTGTKNLPNVDSSLLQYWCFKLHRSVGVCAHTRSVDKEVRCAGFGHYDCYLNKSDKLWEFLASAAVHLRCPLLRDVAPRHLVDWWPVISKQRGDLISKGRRAQCLEMRTPVTRCYNVSESFFTLDSARLARCRHLLLLYLCGSRNACNF